MIEGSKGVLIGGSSGAAIGVVSDIKNSLEKPLNTNAVLGVAIQNIRLNKSEHAYRCLSEKANDIDRIINRRFKNKLGGRILRVGSTEDDTALSEGFDIDLSVPFKPGSFSSTRNMYDELLSFLEDSYDDNDLIKIRKQKKSIGLLFEVEGQELKIDVVPSKLSKGKNNTSGYLHVNRKSIFHEDSRTKTDISALKSIGLNPSQKQIFIALKNWKKNHNVPINSHLLRFLLLDAYACNKGKIPRELTSRILMVVDHIEKVIEHKKIVSVENTNNVLTAISDSDKYKIKRKCSKALDDFEYQPNSILKYFN